MTKRVLFTVFLIIFGIFNIGHAQVEYEGYLVKFSDNYTPIEADLELINVEENLYLAPDNGFCALDRINIEEIEPNIEVDLIEDIRIFSEYSNDFTSYQTEMQAMNPMAFWNLGIFGNPVKVAVIDSGYTYNKDSGNNVLEGKNYYDGTKNVTDDIGHGTHVTGIIAASNDDNYGISGIAPQAKVVPLKCFADGKKTTVDMLVRAINEAVNDYHCDVINMSWGMESKSSALSTALNNAYNKGVILVAAAGNDGDATVNYPAGYSTVIGVGSVDKDKVHSTFSQVNSSVFVSAYGENILSTYIGGDYAYMSGTSQATPAIASFCALCKGCDNSITPRIMSELLMNSCDDLGTSGYDKTYGYGLINGEKLKKNLLKRFFEVKGNKITINNKTDGDLGFKIEFSNKGDLVIPIAKKELRELTLEFDNSTALYSLDDSNYSGNSVSGNFENNGSIISLTDKNEKCSNILKSIAPISDCVGKKVNFYFWDGLSKMKPLTKKVSLEIN